nr:9-kDa hydrophobic protein [Citrus associated ampelovirus 1]
MVLLLSRTVLLLASIAFLQISRSLSVCFTAAQDTVFVYPLMIDFIEFVVRLFVFGFLFLLFFGFYISGLVRCRRRRPPPLF